MYYPGVCLEELKKTMKDISQESQCPRQDLIRAPADCKSEVLHLSQLVLYTSSRHRFCNTEFLALIPQVGLLYQLLIIISDEYWKLIEGLLVGENQNTMRKCLSTTTFYSTDPTSTILGLISASVITSWWLNNWGKEQLDYCSLILVTVLIQNTSVLSGISAQCEKQRNPKEG
jgi:hypothetical protein